MQRVKTQVPGGTSESGETDWMEVTAVLLKGEQKLPVQEQKQVNDELKS